MWRLKTVLTLGLLLLLLIPITALPKKPDPANCPCINAWVWWAWPADCTYDLDWFMRGGWSSASGMSSPITEVRWNAFSNYYTFAAAYGLKEDEGEFVCYVSGTAETLPEPTSIYLESSPLTFEEAWSCVFATKDFLDFLSEQYELCE